MPPFHLPQNKCYGVIKYEKLNYSHRILNIPKIYIFFFFFFNFFFFIYFLIIIFFFFEKKKVGAGGKSGARADENHEC